MWKVLLLAVSCWAGLSWAQYNPNCNGKQVIVHLFEVSFNDIGFLHDKLI